MAQQKFEPLLHLKVKYACERLKRAAQMKGQERGRERERGSERGRQAESEPAVIIEKCANEKQACQHEKIPNNLHRKFTANFCLTLGGGGKGAYTADFHMCVSVFVCVCLPVSPKQRKLDSEAAYAATQCIFNFRLWQLCNCQHVWTTRSTEYPAQ